MKFISTSLNTVPTISEESEVYVLDSMWLILYRPYCSCVAVCRSPSSIQESSIIMPESIVPTEPLIHYHTSVHLIVSPCVRGHTEDVPTYCANFLIFMVCLHLFTTTSKNIYTRRFMTDRGQL
jgi:hypothetical protein